MYRELEGFLKGVERWNCAGVVELMSILVRTGTDSTRAMGVDVASTIEEAVEVGLDVALLVLANEVAVFCDLTANKKDSSRKTYINVLLRLLLL